MLTLETTKAYKKKLKDLRNLHRTFIPNMNFTIQDSLHTLFLPPSGDMVYLVSTKKGSLDEYPISEAYLSANQNEKITTVVINTRFPNLWVALEFDSFGGQMAYLVGTDYVNNFKDRNSYIDGIHFIGNELYRLALKS